MLFANRVIFVAHSQQKIAREGMWRSNKCRSSVIYSGISLRTVSEHPRRPHDIVRIGTAGRISQGKRYEDFIDASYHIHAELPDAFFYIGGGVAIVPDKLRTSTDRSYESLLRTRAQVLVDRQRLQFLGHQRDLAEFLGSLDIFVFTSVVDSFGRVVIEAMACGVPVVAADHGAIREIMLDEATGILVPPCDPASLARALIRLIQDAELRRRLGEEGRKMVEKCFSLQIIGDQWLEIYRHLLFPANREKICRAE